MLLHRSPQIANFARYKNNYMKKSLIIATALALTLCAGCKEKNVNDARVDELMSKMTLAEKSDN